MLQVLNLQQQINVKFTELEYIKEELKTIYKTVENIKETHENDIKRTIQEKDQVQFVYAKEKLKEFQLKHSLMQCLHVLIIKKQAENL